METTPAQAAEGMAVVRVLAAVLDRLVGANAPLARADPGQVTKFHALKAPGIGILQYLERIHKYASCSTECFILALIYIDRLIQRNNFLLTELNVHRVVITSILLAAKFFDDAYYNNAYYAKVGGVLVSEMNSLEVEFLFRIDFSLHVSPELFHKYHAELVSHAVGAGIEAQPELCQPHSPACSQQASPHLASAAVTVAAATTNVAAFPPANPHLQQHHRHDVSDQNQHHYATTHHPLQHPQQITPSPPPPSAHPVAPSSSCYEDMVAAFAATQPHSALVPEQHSVAPSPAADVVITGPMAHQNHFTFLQRHNSLPVTVSHQSHSKVHPVNHHLVAGMTGSNHSRRQSNISISTSSIHSPAGSHASEAEQLLLLENVYQHHGQLVGHYQHHLQHGADVPIGALMHHNGAAVIAASCGGHGVRRHSDISRYVASPASAGSAFRPGHSPASHGPVVTQHFVGGQVLTGVSGGL